VSGLAVMLIAMGIADACRRLTRFLWIPLVVAPIAVAGTAALAGLWHLGDIALLLTAVAASVGWLVLSARTERTGDREWAALAIFGVAVCLLSVLSGWGSDVGGLIGRWPSWVGLDVAPDRLLMITGVVLLQLVTGNQLVRLLLGSVGAVKPVGEPQPSDKLKGGRLLGPMERLLILGLGLAVSWPRLLLSSPPRASSDSRRSTHISASMTSRNTSSSAASPAGSWLWAGWR
jgi:hypothetical protein